MYKFLFSFKFFRVITIVGFSIKIHQFLWKHIQYRYCGCKPNSTQFYSNEKVFHNWLLNLLRWYRRYFQVEKIDLDQPTNIGSYYFFKSILCSWCCEVKVIAELQETWKPVRIFILYLSNRSQHYSNPCR